MTRSPFAPTAALLVAVLLLATAACSNPSSPRQSNRFSWTDDGQSFQASEDGVGALRIDGNLFIVGVVCGEDREFGEDRGFGLTLLNQSGTVGTFAVGGSVLLVRYRTPGDTTRWVAGGGGRRDGGGALTISSVSQSPPRISGMFSFELARDSNFGFGVSLTKSVEGSFDLAFTDQPICPPMVGPA